jgi:uncharacterized 2Fe-2S/4Fe-4S cluster protein (DUF4445 family)
MDDHPVSVTFQPMNRAVTVPNGTPLLSVLREARIPIESICGGKGLCRKCRVILTHGVCGTVFQEGGCRLSEDEQNQGYHYACQVVVTGDCEFIIPIESRIDSPKILISSSLQVCPVAPPVTRYHIDVSSSVKMPSAHWSVRLDGYHGARPQMRDEIYKQISAATAPLLATILTSHLPPKIIRVEPASAVLPAYGIALDLGTTTVVGCLVDLTNGEIVETASVLNRQITYGEELITRIGYAKDSRGLSTLQQAASESINIVISHLVEGAGAARADILDMTVGGNTVMNHLLCGIDPGYLETANAQVSRQPITRNASATGIPMHPDAEMYCLPNVSRFVGGDAIGDVISSGILQSDDLSLIIDLGTNGEIVVGSSDWLAAVSCASGPAFEGAGITAGMRAMKGAIDHCTIDPVTSDVTCSTIGEGLPRGICGSGIIDAAAGMVAAGILDFAGKLVGDHPDVRQGPEGPEYVLLPASKTATGRDLVITQRDVDYLVDSKAAACGGISVLLKRYKISPRDIRNVYLAGAFGAFADMGNAVRFGIIPEFPDAQFHPIGNGSLSGAYAALLSQEYRRLAERAAQMMVYIDLIVDNDFIEEYSAALYIPGRPELFPSHTTGAGQPLTNF